MGGGGGGAIVNMNKKLVATKIRGGGSSENVGRKKVELMKNYVDENKPANCNV